MLAERFDAMGTAMDFVVEAADPEVGRSALAAARSEVSRLEDLLSRFRPNSELSRLNRAREMRVGPDMARVIQTALEMRHRTGELFDPAIGRAVVGSGYDRTFAEVPADHAEPASGSTGGGIGSV